MALGLAQHIPGDKLTIVANVGDDEWFHGMKVCPDVDTILYTLAGIVDKTQGWGVADDTDRALQMLQTLGADDTWMKLGDRDLALHIHRTARLREGRSLSSVVREISRALGICATVVPASDDEMPTVVHTLAGRLRFQEWFVQRRAEPPVVALDYQNAALIRASETALRGVESADLIVIAPSNPLLSILPILAIPGIREAMRFASAPRIVVSPLICGRPVKGPLASLITDLGLQPGNAGIARMYDGFIDAMVVDDSDAHDAASIANDRSISVLTANTRIPDAASSAELAEVLLSWVPSGCGQTEGVGK
ncbi:hypothetical protein AWV80_32995 [Cupriavidus sp. UYMU48A]|nr:hypothetical protein AWV80_32995 [Cupriavidus sp. UYMU48A]